jgi:hypothetical protein
MLLPLSQKQPFSELLQGHLLPIMQVLMSPILALRVAQSTFTLYARCQQRAYRYSDMKLNLIFYLFYSYTTPLFFKLNVNTATGNITIPQYGGQIALNGHESKIIPTKYTFGKSKPIYITAEVRRQFVFVFLQLIPCLKVLTQTTIDNTDHVLLFVPSGQSVEIVVTGPKVTTPIINGTASISARLLDGLIVITGVPSGLTYVTFGSAIVLIMDRATATSFWQPCSKITYDLAPSAPGQAVLVGGRYLVRSATIYSSTLALVGDTNTTTPIIVIASSANKQVT